MTEKRTAVVVGGGSGMGAAAAETIASQGHDVVVGDIDVAAARRTCGAVAATALPIEVDVRDRESVNGMVAEANVAFGRPVSIMVYCAGVLHRTRFLDISFDEWRLQLDVNLDGAFHCAQAVLPGMIDLGWGRLVIFSSSAGKSVSTLGGAHYTASKSALLGLTRALAKEFGSAGITCNAICPGLIDTPMVSRTASSAEIAGYIAGFPIARLGTPEEVAALAAFLVSDAAAYITGTSVDINGGDLII